MEDYGLIKTILAGIYSVSTGYDEGDAIQALDHDIHHNQEFSDRFKRELKLAFYDPSVSWKDWFLEYEVYPFEDEDHAREYAVKILWNVAFKDQSAPRRSSGS